MGTVPASRRGLNVMKQNLIERIPFETQAVMRGLRVAVVDIIGKIRFE